MEWEGDNIQSTHISFPNEGFSILNERLNQDGYLHITSIIPQKDVIAARKVVYSQLSTDGLLEDGSTLDTPKGKGALYMGNKAVTHHPDFLKIVESPNLFSFFKKIFHEEANTFDYKWARVVAPGTAGTNAHQDVVYMGRGSQRLLTCWIPIGDIPIKNGPIAILPGTHTVKKMKHIRSTYGKMDVDRDGIDGWFTNNFLELSNMVRRPWVSNNFLAGDIVILNMRVFHGSVKNDSRKLRFTVDTRFQPKSDPIDDRWVGHTPKAHSELEEKRIKNQVIAMQEARTTWGV